MKRIVIIMIIVSMLLFTSVAATILPPPGIETQGITLTTDVSALGIFSNNADLTWRHSSEVLDANLNLVDVLWDPETGLPIVDPETGDLIEVWELQPEPPLKYDSASFEVQMTTVYSEDTNAQYGEIAYSKNSMIDTKALPASMFNVENDRIITYTGLNGKRILSDENLVLSGAGTPGVPSALSTTCAQCIPTGCGCYPAFCSFVDTGSTIDMSVVSASTSAEVRNLNKMGGGDGERWPPIPSVDGPAHLSYSIRVSELSSTQPSVGYVSTYLNLETNEAGTWCVGKSSLMQDISMKERKSVDGYVSLFSNIVEYESAICCR
jgi:hypothetical protein